MVSIEEVNETDVVLLKDGRMGTVMGIYPGTTGLEVETDDSDPDTETHDVSDVVVNMSKDNMTIAVDLFKEKMLEDLDKIPHDNRNEFHNYINREYYKVFEKHKKNVKGLAKELDEIDDETSLSKENVASDEKNEIYDKYWKQKQEVIKKYLN